MAGVKGRSGGARPGAGRKPKPPTAIAPETAQVVDGEPMDPRPTLELVALGHVEVSTQQMKALVALLPYVHPKKGAEAAGKQKPAVPEAPAANKYGVRAAPRLAASGGKKV